jgi:hypothetical protein
VCRLAAGRAERKASGVELGLPAAADVVPDQVDGPGSFVRDYVDALERIRTKGVRIALRELSAA